MTRLANHLFGALVLLAALPAFGGGGDIEIGRAIYQEGRLPSGKTLVGKRFGSSQVSGPGAACATCHGRSGMGTVEGDVMVAPITGKALFSGDERVVATMDPRRGKAFNQDRPPYTDASLARALREGMHVTGREMSRLMPRYALDDREMRDLAAYLKQLSTEWSPGVTAERISFATVITPEVDPARRAILVDMVNAAVAGKNGSTRPGRRYMASAAEMLMKTGRTWDFQVWELGGPPETWEAQLADFYRKNPVFAIVSGLSESTWEPIDAFCQREKIPCLLPSIDLPPSREEPYYPVYFSRGVALEAGILAAYLQGLEKAGPRRVVQVFPGGPIGEGAADSLSERLGGGRIAVENRRLERLDAQELARSLEGLGRDDAVVFWLRARDFPLLGKLDVPQAGHVFFSGRLGDGRMDGLPAGWRERAEMIYPYELPEKRRANSAYLHSWLKLRKLPVVSEPLQSEIFFALNFVNDTVSEMLNNLYRDYFIERTVNTMAFREGSKAEQELRDRGTLGRVTLRGNNPPGSSLDETREMFALAHAEQGRGIQTGTTVYPRLSLGPGQRFASKGGYLVKFDGARDNPIVPLSDWLVP